MVERLALPKTRRVERRNGHSYLLDGETCMGVTTILDKGVPKPALVGWAAKVTAERAIDRWDELIEMQPSARLAFLKSARYDDRDAAARRGTEVHEYAQRLQRGEEVTPPEELSGHVDSYLKFVDEWDPYELLVEVVVINRTWRYMGTLDTIADLADGNRWLLDFKTNRSGVFSEAALQLTAYRFAEAYLDDEFNEQPMPAVDRVGVLWLRADGYDLVPIDASQRVFETFLHAKKVARYLDQPREAVIGEALRPPSEEVS